MLAAGHHTYKLHTCHDIQQVVNFVIIGLMTVACCHNQYDQNQCHASSVMLPAAGKIASTIQLCCQESHNNAAAVAELCPCTHDTQIKAISVLF